MRKGGRYHPRTEPICSFGLRERGGAQGSCCRREFGGDVDKKEKGVGLSLTVSHIWEKSAGEIMRTFGKVKDGSHNNITFCN